MRKSDLDIKRDWFWNRALLPFRFVYHYLSWFITWSFFRLFYDLRVYGRGNIPKKGSFIVAPNHESHLDPPLIGVAILKPLRYFAKIELFRANILFSLLIRSQGAVPISPSAKDLKRLFRWVEYFKKTNQPFVLFPEGERTRDGQLLAPKPGIGLLVQYLKLPVLPVYIEGTFEALPRGAKWISPSKIRVFIGKPMDFNRKYNLNPKKLDKELARSIAEDVMTEIKQLKQLCQQKELS